MMDGMKSSQSEERHSEDGKPVITVIVPVHDDLSELPQIRESVRSSVVPSEIIIVINGPSLVGKVAAQGPYERVVVAPRVGRGYAFAEGASHAKADISLLLHSDTLLPKTWDSAIVDVMKDPKTAGGAFSRTFDEDNVYLKLFLPLGSVFSWVLGDVWGDRGIFLRTRILKDCIHSLDVPIMEDVRLGRCMRDRGRVRLLRERVVTSARAFRRYGRVRHTIRFLKCRIWYALGGDLDKIFDYYYPKR
jgi:glycosyltransferase involved in cell wall biosynthesis